MAIRMPSKIKPITTMPPIKLSASRSCPGKPGGLSDPLRSPRIKARTAPKRTIIPVTSNRKAVIGWFLSSMGQVTGHSGAQRDVTRAIRPQKNLKTNGRKIRLWMSQRAPDCLKSLLCRSTSKIIALTIRNILREKRVLMPLHNRSKSTPIGPLCLPPGAAADSQ